MGTKKEEIDDYCKGKFEENNKVKSSKSEWYPETFECTIGDDSKKEGSGILYTMKLTADVKQFYLLRLPGASGNGKIRIKFESSSIVNGKLKYYICHACTAKSDLETKKIGIEAHCKKSFKKRYKAPSSKVEWEKDSNAKCSFDVDKKGEEGDDNLYKLKLYGEAGEFFLDTSDEESEGSASGEEPKCSADALGLDGVVFTAVDDEEAEYT